MRKALFAIAAGAGLAASSHVAEKWRQLPDIPEPLGVAAPFAGVSGGSLLVGGGANFPNGFPWESGKKVWHDRVWALDAPDAKWREVGRLLRPIAYGVSATFAGDMVCVGGSDAERHFADVFRLRLVGGKLVIENLAPLPVSLANHCGAIVLDRHLYIAGGAAEPGEKAASNRVFSLDLRGGVDAAWREHEPLPGRPRFLSLAAADADGFYILGGVALDPRADGTMVRVYLRDAWRLSPEGGWKQLADAPKPIAAAPSPAPQVGGEFLIAAGDDGSLAGFQPLERHPGFPAATLAYNPVKNTWREIGRTPAPRATLPCVEWRDAFVFPSGEMRPGVRSPQVWSLTKP